MTIKTDDKKQHFDDIYVAKNPVRYKVEILDKLEYISDTFNREMFDAHILAFCQQKASKTGGGCVVNFVDLCCCFGNTTMATIYGMSYKDICENWKDDESCMTIQAKRRFATKVSACDISEPALAYGKQVGLYDEAIACNLNDRDSEAFAQSKAAMAQADVLLSTAALVYLDLATIEELVGAFAGKSGEGYVLVNFLNPFALEKADDTKRILLKHLDFVGSRATRHRRLSPLEQSNYPGEEWSLLELWVLKRRG